MLREDPGNVSYSAVGGLSDQIRELRESIELPLMNPELFLRVGIKPPKVFPLSRARLTGLPNSGFLANSFCIFIQRVFFCMALLVLARHC